MNELKSEPQKLIKINGKHYPVKLAREGEPPVYMLEDARFVVELAGKFVIKASMRQVDNAIRKGNPTLKLMGVHTSITFQSRSVQVMDVMDILESRIVDADGKKHYKGWDRWHLYNAELAAQLEDLNKRIEKAERDFNKEFEKINKKMKGVDRGNFKEMLAKHGTGHGKDKDIPDIFEGMDK